MKEKISCSLDGELLGKMDEVLDNFPVIGSRSALLEMAVLSLLAQCTNPHTHEYDVHYILMLYQGRCFLNGQKESKN